MQDIHDKQDTQDKRTIFPLCLLCVSLLLFSSSLYAASDFSAQVALSTTTLNLENPLQVDLTLHFPHGYRVDVDSLARNLLKHHPLAPEPFQLLGTKNNIEEHAGEITQQLTFLLQPEIPGHFFLSFFKISFLPENAQGATKETISEPFELSVEPLNMSLNTPPYSILPFSFAYPIELNDSNREKFRGEVQKEAARQQVVESIQAHAFPWLHLLAAFFLILFLIILRYAPIQRKEKMESEEEQLVKIKSRCEQLVKSLQKDNSPDTYVQLSNLLRELLEKRYGVPAPFQTTQEFLQSLAGSPKIEPELKQQVKAFLAHADHVKFAKKLPSQEAYTHANEIVKGL